MSTERRKHRREPVHVPATVVGNGGLSRIPAEIVDRTVAGVRIRMADHEKLGADSYLLFGHRIEPFRVVWQAKDSAGLLFVG